MCSRIRGSAFLFIAKMDAFGPRAAVDRHGDCVRVRCVGSAVFRLLLWWLSAARDARDGQSPRSACWERCFAECYTRYTKNIGDGHVYMVVDGPAQKHSHCSEQYLYDSVLPNFESGMGSPASDLCNRPVYSQALNRLGQSRQILAVK
jgi:hypothetical protein